MGNVTKSELAALLTKMSSELNAAGDQMADPTAVDCVKTLMRIVGQQQNQSAGGPMKSECATQSFAFSGGSLSERVEKIKNATASGRPLSDEFRRDVESHDKTRCVGSLVFEDLWNGFGGWKSPDAFWELVVYLWKNAPGFFDEQYDSERPISENQDVWTQRYFDDQRNYLRHNFCLERLCHLVMVYEYLHGAEVKVHREGSRKPTSEVAVQPQSVANPQKAGHSRWRVMMIIAPAILLLGTTAYLLEKHNSGARETSTATECDRQRVKSCNAEARHALPANEVQSNKVLIESSQRSPSSKDESRQEIQTNSQIVQATNTVPRAPGQMNQQMTQGTNDAPHLSRQAKPQKKHQGTNAAVLLSEREKSGERATVSRTNGSGSR